MERFGTSDITGVKSKAPKISQDLLGGLNLNQIVEEDSGSSQKSLSKSKSKSVDKNQKQKKIKSKSKTDIKAFYNFDGKKV